MFSSIELAHVYNLNKVGLKNFERLVEEHGILSIAGHSHTLNDSVKIVWYNQTRVLNSYALHLYERLGFTQLGKIPQGFRMKDGHYEDIIPHYILLK